MSLNKSMEFIRSEYLKNFMAKMKDLENYHDVTLIAGDDNTRITAHRLVLKSASDYFRAMFDAHFVEAEKKEVTIEEIDGPTLKFVVDFIYTCDGEITSDNVLDIVAAATIMGVTALEKACCNYWERTITEENCIEYMLIADQYGFDSLLLKAYQVIGSNWKKLSNTADFTRIDQKNLVRILETRKITANQKHILDGVVKWLKIKDPEKTEVSVSLLTMIALEQIPTDIIASHVEALFTEYGMRELIVDQYRERALRPNEPIRIPLHRRIVHHESDDDEEDDDRDVRDVRDDDDSDDPDGGNDNDPDPVVFDDIRNVRHIPFEN